MRQKLVSYFCLVSVSSELWLFRIASLISHSGCCLVVAFSMFLIAPLMTCASQHCYLRLTFKVRLLCVQCVWVCVCVCVDELTSANHSSTRTGCRRRNKPAAGRRAPTSSTVRPAAAAAPRRRGGRPTHPPEAPARSAAPRPWPPPAGTSPYWAAGRLLDRLHNWNMVVRR